MIISPTAALRSSMASTSCSRCSGLVPAKSAESPTTEEMKARASSLFGWKIALLLDRSASSPVSADTAPRLPIFALEGLARPPDGPWAALPDGVPPAMMIASIHRRASSSLVPLRMYVVSPPLTIKIVSGSPGRGVGRSTRVSIEMVIEPSGGFRLLAAWSVADL